jgi:hypothetical protein
LLQRAPRFLLLSLQDVDVGCCRFDGGLRRLHAGDGLIVGGLRLLERLLAVDLARGEILLALELEVRPRRAGLGGGELRLGWRDVAPRAGGIESELKRLGREFSRFMLRPGGVSELRTVMAIADRMPELGAKFYLSGPAMGIGSLKKYLEDKVAAGLLQPHDCEVAAAQLIDACVSTTFKPMLFNHAGPPSKERIGHVVDMAVGAFLAAYSKG